MKIQNIYKVYIRERAEGLHKLQRDMNTLGNASRSWNLKLNPYKYSVMRFGERTPNVNISDYHIDVVPLKHEPIYKDMT